ncbi:hypothetical protein PSACC_00901 [Paramicrosporidium saccamoebae]|uniref:Uncharacterized protein n=1 Tax=Paramicrosporidium saccamoebae TaxID=1246581 RepID=A0A2H9TNE1_9FUNG|nr:hypothetical protein PSACC_00901 [Paramicrosporidium saccamoebae]
MDWTETAVGAETVGTEAAGTVAGTGTVGTVVVAAGGAVGEVGGRAVGGDCRSCHSPIASTARKRLINFSTASVGRYYRRFINLLLYSSVPHQCRQILATSMRRFAANTHAPASAK